jgi:hypothetical protein
MSSLSHQIIHLGHNLTSYKVIYLCYGSYWKSKDKIHSYINLFVAHSWLAFITLSVFKEFVHKQTKAQKQLQVMNFYKNTCTKYA